MSDALLMGNFQPNYCIEFEGTCPYLGAFIILPGYKGLDDCVCMQCIMTMSCVRIHESMKIKNWWELTKETGDQNDNRTDEST
jgi:hypothetical protein